MTGTKWDKIDEVADGLDELHTTVDELKADPPAAIEPEAVDTLKKALERATDAADELENQKED